MLSDAHKRAIFFAFLDIHRRMAEVEAILARHQTPPFDTHMNDLSPEEIDKANESFAGLRAAMQDCLRDSQISMEAKPTSVRWALQCCMSAIAIAVSEINPARLKAYGPLDSAAEVRIRQIQESLRSFLAGAKTPSGHAQPDGSDSAPTPSDAGDIDGN